MHNMAFFASVLSRAVIFFVLHGSFFPKPAVFGRQEALDESLDGECGIDETLLQRGTEAAELRHELVRTVVSFSALAQANSSVS